MTETRETTELVTATEPTTTAQTAQETDLYTASSTSNPYLTPEVPTISATDGLTNTGSTLSLNSSCLPQTPTDTSNKGYTAHSTLSVPGKQTGIKKTKQFQTQKRKSDTKAADESCSKKYTSKSSLGKANEININVHRWSYMYQNNMFCLPFPLFTLLALFIIKHSWTSDIYCSRG